MLERAVFLEPTYDVYLEDKLFDLNDPLLNRDDVLLPLIRLRDAYMRRGIPVHTADFLHSGKVVARQNDYWSLGEVNKYGTLLKRADVRLRVFILPEPPLIVPATYRKLDEICRDFELTYLYNTECDGYRLSEPLRSKVRKAYFSQPYAAEVEPYWGREDRLNKLVVIAGSHNPRFRKPEYYSARIHAIAKLIDLDAIDLFGRGWDRWWSPQAAWPAYWLNLRSIRRAYRGTCTSKLQVLSQYRFSLCFENTPMRGYITEKIFDCLYAGTVPVYLGAPDVSQYIPRDVYIDMRSFNSYQAMFASIKSMSTQDWQRMRAAGRDFLRHEGKENYFHALDRIISELEA